MMFAMCGIRWSEKIYKDTDKYAVGRKKVACWCVILWVWDSTGDDVRK